MCRAFPRIAVWVMAVSALALGAGCEKQAGFVNQALVPGGVSFYPVSNNPLIDAATGSSIANGFFFAGDTLTFEVDYESQDTLSGVSLYAGAGAGLTLVDSLPFQPSDYSYSRQIDTALFRFDIPDSILPGTEFFLDIIIRNTNSLSLSRPLHFSIR